MEKNDSNSALRQVLRRIYENESPQQIFTILKPASYHSSLKGDDLNTILTNNGRQFNPSSIYLQCQNNLKDVLWITSQKGSKKNCNFDRLEMWQFETLFSSLKENYQIKIRVGKLQTRRPELRNKSQNKLLNENTDEIMSPERKFLDYEQIGSFKEFDLKYRNKIRSFTLQLQAIPKFSLQKQTTFIQSLIKNASAYRLDSKIKESKQNVNEKLLKSQENDKGNGCLVEVYAHFGQIKHMGTGSLLSKDLILTCAGILFYQRRKPDKILIKVESSGQLIEVDSYRYPYLFQRMIYRQTNDYALLHLSRPIHNKKYLKIAVNIFNKRNQSSLFDFSFKNQPIHILFKGQNMIYYEAKTNRGDCGLPIIMKSPIETYVVGLHIGAKEVIIQNQLQHKNFGLKITYNIVKELQSFAFQMSKDSKIFKQLAIEQDSMIIMKMFTNYLEKTSFYFFELSHQDSQQFSHSKQILRDEVLLIWNDFTKGWIKNVNNYQEIKQGIIDFLQEVKKNENDLEALWIKEVKYLKILIVTLNNLFRDYHNEWIAIIINQKLLVWQEENLPELFLLSKIQRMSILKNKTKDPYLGLDPLFHGYPPLLQKNIRVKTPCFSQKQFFRPFLSFISKGHYRIRDKCYFQYEYKVKMQSEQECQEAIWNSITLPNLNIPLLMTTKDDEEELTVKTTFRTFCKPYTLLDFVKQNKEGDSKVILKLLVNITETLSELHSLGIFLCNPLEYSMFIEPQSLEPLFFNFQTPKSLYSFIERQNLAEQQSHLSSFYPIDEILQNKGSLNHCQGIESWMLSKSFDRIMTDVNFEGYNNNKWFRPSLKLRMSQMRFLPPNRLTVTNLKEILTAMLKDKSQIDD